MKMHSKIFSNNKMARSFLIATIATMASITAKIDCVLAYPIIGASYQVNGTAGFFNANSGFQNAQLLTGSSYRFDADGIFRLNLQTNFGNTSVELGFDLGSFGNSELALKPATQQYAQRVINHINTNSGYRPDTDVNMDGFNSPIDALLLINDLNSNSTSAVYKQIGMHNPNGAAPIFIATAMNGVFRQDGTFTIWNGQYNLAGQLLGATDWWLSSGDPITLPNNSVPEPFSLVLLGSGLAGLVARKKHTKFLNL